MRADDEAVSFLREHLATPGLDAAGQAAAWTGLARVHHAAGRPDQALDALMQAYRSGNDRATIAQLVVSLPNASSGQLADAVVRFYRDGETGAGLAGDERLIRTHLAAGEPQAADRALVRWLHAAGAARAFDLARWDRLHEGIEPTADARSSLFVELGALLAQVRNGIDLDEREETTVAKRYANAVPTWCKTRGRREALALGLRSLADRSAERAYAGPGAEGHRSIAGIYEVALDIALRGGNEPAQPPTANPPETVVEVPFDVGLAIAIDLAVYYNNHRDIEAADGSVGVSRDRFRRLVRDSTKDPSARGLAKGPLSLDVWAAIEPRIPREQHIEYWGMIGLVFSDTGWLTAHEDRELAIRYLRNAVDIGRADGERLPRLEAKLAEVLAITERPIPSLNAYTDAALDYRATDQPRAARRTARHALQDAYTTRGQIDDRIRRLELLLHPRDGFYVGGSFGLTDGHQSGAELQNELNRRTPAGRDVSVSLDDTDVGYKGYGGYRFDAPFALEVGYTGLEGPKSRITASVVDPQLVPDIAELHPLTGRGPSLSVLAFPYECGRLSTFVRLGYWFWQADVNIALNGTTIHRAPHGSDFVVGAGAQYRFLADLSARVEYERYFLDDDDVDLFTVGLLWTF